jgi:hypothetical protein
MRDLAEVRRFWPKAAEIDFCGPLYVARPVRRHELTIAESLGGGWFLSDWRDGGPELSAVYRGPTIAAAMAAAGFGVRKKGWRAIDRKGRTEVSRAWQKGSWPDYCRVPPQSRQRPRKRVRLGGKARRLACWMAIYRDSSLVTAAQVRASY